MSALATPTPSDASFATAAALERQHRDDRRPRRRSVVPLHSVLVSAASTTTSTDAPAATTLQRGRREAVGERWAAAECRPARRRCGIARCTHPLGRSATRAARRHVGPLRRQRRQLTAHLRDRLIAISGFPCHGARDDLAEATRNELGAGGGGSVSTATATLTKL